MPWVLLGGSREADEMTIDYQSIVNASSGDGTVYLVLEPVTARQLQHVADYFRNHLRVPAANRDAPTWRDFGRADITSSVIHIFGGNPADYVQRLCETPELQAISRAEARGATLVGSSAGVECLGMLARDLSLGVSQEAWRPGLGIFPKSFLATHWSSDAETDDPAQRDWRRQFNDYLVAGASAAREFVAIEERTGMVGDGRSWRVVGHGAVHRLLDDEWGTFGRGDAFEVDLLAE